MESQFLPRGKFPIIHRRVALNSTAAAVLSIPKPEEGNLGTRRVVVQVVQQQTLFNGLCVTHMSSHVACRSFESLRALSSAYNVA